MVFSAFRRRIEGREPLADGGDPADDDGGRNDTAGGGAAGNGDGSAGSGGDPPRMPDGGSMTAREEAALRRIRSVSRLLDEAVRVPGTDFRVGLDPVLGVVPGAGDAVAAALSLYPLVEAYRFDAPKGTLARMLALVAVDAVVGSIPVVGPVFDAFWKANEWNLRVLQRHVRQA